MFEYVCDKLIPGCEHTLEAVTEVELHELAKHHLREHHDIEYADEQGWLMISKAVIPIVR
jgi:predicted small metal-binding protein